MGRKVRVSAATLLPTCRTAPTVARRQSRELVMAWAQIRYSWPDGSSVELEAGSHEAGYPDELAELVARVIDMYRVTCMQAEGE